MATELFDLNKTNLFRGYHLKYILGDLQTIFLFTENKESVRVRGLQ